MASCAALAHSISNGTQRSQDSLQDTHTLLFLAVDTKSLPIDGYLFKPFSYGVESKIMDIFSLRFLLLYQQSQPYRKHTRNLCLPMIPIFDFSDKELAMRASADDHKFIILGHCPHDEVRLTVAGGRQALQVSQ